MIKALKTSLSVQVLTSVALVLVFLCYVIVCIGSWEITKAVIDQYVNAAYHTARTARTYLNPDHIADYLTADGGNHPEERRQILSEWQRLADRDSQEVLMIYLIQTEGEDYGRIRFGLTAVHPSLLEDYPEMVLYPGGTVAKSGDAQRKAYAEIYQGAKYAMVVQPQQWEEDHITVVIPVKTKEDRVAGLICVQRKMEKLRTVIYRHAYKVLGWAMLLLAVILYLVLWGLRRWLLKPIAAVTKEISRFAVKNSLSESKLGESIRTSNEIGRLARAIDTMEEQTVDYIINLTHVTRKQEQVQSELNVARNIQLSMLPDNFAIRSEIDIAAIMDAAKEVGGDFYNFYTIDENRVAFIIADVSGKGVPAALTMSKAQILLANFIYIAPDEPGALAEAVSYANFQLCRGNDSLMFATVFAGVLNVKTGKFTYVNAGHNPPLLLRNGVFEYMPLAQNGFLGIDDKAKFKEDSLSLLQGDGILFYTDGVTEAENREHEFFGEVRLLDALNVHAVNAKNLSAQELIDYVKSQVAAFVRTAPQSDDLTMMYVRYLQRGDINV